MRYPDKPDLTRRPYRLLKSDLAAKLSPRSQGGITYYLLADETELYLAIVGNEGGGLWSKETGLARCPGQARRCPFWQGDHPWRRVKAGKGGRRG